MPSGCFGSSSNAIRRTAARSARSSIWSCRTSSTEQAATRTHSAISVAAAELHPTDATILEALARMSFAAGDFEGAERSYRVLLLLLRSSSVEARAGICRTEVYVELSELATRRDEADRAE